jgi:flavorubredoxin
MRAVVIYESMYGNTHLIASAVAEGLAPYGEATVVHVGEAGAEMIEGADLLVVGGPTHAHGMSRPSTRQGAVAAARKPESPLVVEPDAAGEGVREWLESLGSLHLDAAAFDTRVDFPVAITGHASKGIAKRLHQHGAKLVAEPHSFLVSKQDQLEPHEEERAREWGAELGRAVAREHAAT